MTDTTITHVVRFRGGPLNAIALHLTAAPGATLEARYGNDRAVYEVTPTTSVEDARIYHADLAGVPAPSDDAGTATVRAAILWAVLALLLIAAHVAQQPPDTRDAIVCISAAEMGADGAINVVAPELCQAIPS